jgi:predicted PurR-regulated permease PerM
MLSAVQSRDVVLPADREGELERALPFGIRVAGAWSWRLIGIVILGAVALYLIGLLHIVVIPVLVAVLLSGLLTPIKNRLQRLGLPKGIAVAITFLGLLVGIAALIVLVVLTLRTGIGDFQTRAVQSYKNLIGVAKASPFGITEQDVSNAIASATKTIQKNSGAILAGALARASIVSDILVGLLLALFSTLFFLIDGAGIWRWCVRLFPHRARAAVNGGGAAAWLSIGEYARVQVIVALIDAVGIGLGAFILHVPFAVPLAVLVFLGAFIPIVGAVVTGFLAVIAALVYNDPVNALIMLAVVIAVNQLESHVLQPLLMGGAVRLHPVAVVLAVAIGSLLAGIAGAVFAVPITAAANSAIRYIAGGAWKGQPEPWTGGIPGEQEGDGGRDQDSPDPRPKDVTTVA